MISSNGEYITVDFTAEELMLISDRAGYLAELDELHPFWKQAYWQLALTAHHLHMLLERDEKGTDRILENYEG